jgi:5-methyltetrahydrofolate--homocysteine methyltransferase
MRIIGEKINGTRKAVAQAIAARDADFIQSLARRQWEAGSYWLDLNAGTHPDREVDDLIWLVEVVQATGPVRLSLDSANPAALAAALPHVSQPPLINSISGEPARLEGILPLAAKHGCPAIALAMDGIRMPATVEDRMVVVRRVVAAARAAGVADEALYVDPLVMTVGTNTEAGRLFLDGLRAVKAEFPKVHLTAGLSNVSFGLPARALVNRTFLTLAMGAGLDSAILDPLDAELRAALLATELLLGQDRHCLNYTRAYRAGRLGGQGGEGPKGSKGPTGGEGKEMREMGK